MPNDWATKSPLVAARIALRAISRGIRAPTAAFTPECEEPFFMSVAAIIAFNAQGPGNLPGPCRGALCSLG